MNRYIFKIMNPRPMDINIFYPLPLNTSPIVFLLFRFHVSESKLTHSSRVCLFWCIHKITAKRRPLKKILTKYLAN